MSKDNFLYHNRWKLTIIAVILGIIGQYLAVKIEGAHSTPTQWFIFLIIMIFFIYIHFISGILIEESDLKDDLNYTFEEKELPNDLFSTEAAPTLLEITNEVEAAANENNDQIAFRDDIKEAMRDKKNKMVYLVQPIIVTQNELTSKLEEMKNTNDAEKLVQSGASGPVKELVQEEKGVVTYATRMVPYRYRGMYDDIHGFAITAGPQTTDNIVKKIQPYGYPFKKIDNGPKLVAFDFGFIRMPEAGYFGVKLPEPKIEEEKKDDVEPDWKARD